MFINSPAKAPPDPACVRVLPRLEAAEYIVITRSGEVNTFDLESVKVSYQNMICPTGLYIKP